SLDKSEGRLQSLIPGVAPVLLEQVAELDHHRYRDRRFAHGHAADLLRDVVFEEAEVARRNSRDEVALIVEHRNIDRDDVYVALEGGEIAAEIGLVLLAVRRGDFRKLGFALLFGLGGLTGFAYGRTGILEGSLCLADRQAGEHYECSAQHNTDSPRSHRQFSEVTISEGRAGRRYRCDNGHNC